MVLISVDGERDTPAVIKKYLASFSDASVENMATITRLVIDEN